jgi:multiple sugar transport system permease protein
MKSKNEERYFKKTTRFAYRIIIPSLLFVIVFVAIPLLYSIYISFQEFKYGVPTGNFVWFENYVDIFTSKTASPGFYKSLLITFEFTIVAVIAVVVISFLIALLIDQEFRGNNLIKIALLLPYAIPGAVSAVIWNWIYDPSFGVLNGLLYALGIIDKYFSIASNPNLALWGILFAYVWKIVPYSTFLFSAGLSTIPKSVYEAAKLDRSGFFRTLSKIIIPMMMPVIQMVLVIQTIFALVLHFGLVFVITQGGPGDATRTLAWHIYKETFTFTRFGRGAAMALILSLIMVIFIYIYLVVLNPDRSQKRRQERFEKEAA